MTGSLLDYDLSYLNDFQLGLIRTGLRARLAERTSHPATSASDILTLAQDLKHVETLIAQRETYADASVQSEIDAFVNDQLDVSVLSDEALRVRRDQIIYNLSLAGPAPSEFHDVNQREYAEITAELERRHEHD